MIIRTRRRWIAVASAFAEQGVLPPNVDNPKAYRLRSGEVILPRSADWWDGSQPSAGEVARQPAGGSRRRRSPAASTPQGSVSEGAPS